MKSLSIDFVEFDHFRETGELLNNYSQKESLGVDIKLKEPDPDFARVMLGGKVHLVTPVDEARKRIAEIKEKLLRTRSETIDPFDDRR